MKLKLLALALLLTTPAVAAADTKDPKDTPITVDVDVTETAPKKDDQITTFTLALSDRGCATAETSQGTIGYEVKVCREGGDVLSFEVQRTERTKDSATNRHIRVASKLTTGKRVVVAKIARGDTDATEVAATVR